MKISIFKVKIAMARLQITRKQLAERTGLSEVTIDAYMQGRIQPSLPSLGKLAEALKVDVMEIIEMD